MIFVFWPISGLQMPLPPKKVSSFLWDFKVLPVAGVPNKNSRLIVCNMFVYEIILPTLMGSHSYCSTRFSPKMIEIFPP